jgi:hypothetical protein
VSDTRGLLDRISAFRQRLDATPQLTPVAAAVEPQAVAIEAEAFRQSVRRLGGAPDEVADAPLPQYTDRAKRLLAAAKDLLDRQRQFSADPYFAALAAEAQPDALVPYHRETVAVLDAVVRMAQAFPDSAAAQLRLCDGLDGLLNVVRDRQAVGARALAARRADVRRIDRIAAVYAAVQAHQPCDLQVVANIGEELLDEARQGLPMRFVRAEPASIRSHAGGPTLPAPARFIAAHAVNVAQVVARVVPFDYEWAGRPLLPVVTALVMDIGMLTVPPRVLAKAEPLGPGERRVIESHPKYGAELLLYCFPTLAGPLAAAVATHHERGDGTGYPGGLSGADVPPLGRLLRACDVYAALREDRPHRPALDPRAALTEVLLMAEQGQVDRDFAEYLLNLAFYPVGSAVELVDGRIGVVVSNRADRMDPRAPAKPVVSVLVSADGTLLPRPECIDLSASDRGGIACGVPAAKARELLGARYPDLVA